MASDKDLEQDEMIRRNAEHIQRNEDAIRRQTEALEQIRDHYFPKTTLWKSICGFLLKVVGAVAVYAGLAETADWYWNTRQTEGMAAQSAAVSKRLFQLENDPVGAARFLEKAVELNSGKVKYRIALAYVKGIAVLIDFFDLQRPLTPEERARVDATLADAIFLQETADDEPMPHILAAQAYLLRGERELAAQAVERAVALDPESAIVRINACAIRLNLGDGDAARRELAAAARIDPGFPLVHYWKGMLADLLDHDPAAALAHFREMVRVAPRAAIGHVGVGRMLMAGEKPDLPGARAEFERALAAAPRFKDVMRLVAETHLREGNPVLARLWLDRALKQDATFMNGLVARARVCGVQGDWKAALADLDAAVDLAPFRADLRRERAKAHEAAGDAAAAAKDRETAAALDRAAH